MDFAEIKIKVLRGLQSLFGGSRGESVSLPFLTSQGYLHSLVYGLILPSLRLAVGGSSASQCLSLTFSSASLFYF